MVRTKVFVGNLAFSTKEAELAKHFESAGKVISANIITRGPRSLGYGFVEMESEQDAENAVKQLDKKEIDGRPINVEVAKPREENATNNAQGQDQAQGQRNNQGQQGGNNANGARPRNNRRPRQRRNQGQGQQGGNQGGNNQGQVQQGGNQAQGNQNNQGQRNNQGQGQQGGNKQATSGQQTQSGQPRQPRTRQPRQRPEGEVDTRTPSTTTLFVANLPYALDNDAFGKVLKDGTLAFKSATVSTKKKSGLSKGFGFIEFDNEVDQQKALAALQGKKISERDIVVKVALTGGRDDAAKAAATTTGAPADVVTPTNKPSEIKANVVAATKQAEKPTTPKQERK